VRDGLALVSQYLTDVIRGLLLGFYPAEARIGFAQGWAPYYFPPLTLLFVLLVLARPPEPLRRPVRVWAAVTAVVSALVSANVFMGVHYNRYLMWAFPTVLVLAAAGMAEAAHLLARGDAALERALFRTGALLAVGLAALSTVRFAALYGETAGQVYRRDWAAARWILAELPPGVAIANVATSVEYLTGHRNLNLHGVTSPAFFGTRTAEREAGMYEALVRLPPAQRPAYLITSAATQAGSAILPELVDGPPLFQTASLGDDILVHRMRWDLVDKSPRLFLPATRAAIAGLRETDRLNVCDSRDEAGHGYTWRSRLGGLRLFGAPRVDAYALASGRELVADAGRVILGAEAFRVRTRPGRDLVVVMRTAAGAAANVYAAAGSASHTFALAGAALAVSANGKGVGRLGLDVGTGWNEIVFRVPAHLVGDGTTQLELRGRYASFHYWFYQ